MLSIAMNLSGCALDEQFNVYLQQWLSGLQIPENGDEDIHSGDGSSLQIEDSYDLTLDDNENGAFG